MPRVCTICSHKERAEIEKALEAGGKLKGLAGKYKVSTAALSRHRGHMEPVKKPEKEPEEESDKINLVVLACPRCGEAEIYFNGWEDGNTAVIYCPWCKHIGYIRNLAFSEINGDLRLLHTVAHGAEKPPAWEQKKEQNRAKR